MAANFVGPVEMLFRLQPTDAAELARQLFQANRRSYEAVINAQLEALGQVPNFRLTNRDELLRLRREATESARSIADTYNRDLAARVDAVVEAERTRGLNRHTLARRLNDWDVERQGWKQEQIQRTEAARTSAARAARVPTDGAATSSLP